MTKLLLRLFVKNYENSEDMMVRASVGKLAGKRALSAISFSFWGNFWQGFWLVLWQSLPMQ